ncbi:hypothetical protein [Methylobacterium sp. J-068]|uniref:hypothetical protein n=1 Tax=Methylobacterium sp. J-068 TaxID=2836649 RepID=UPI001FB934B9|nr:hypothetical protein [Methylobacterium sp. J-068]MCJ2034114.1 hypothetical protein [Methylobacterium sp. J-068]
MERPEADPTTDAQGLSRHDLVVIPGGAVSGTQGLRPVPARPLAEFLAQLLVSTESRLRPSRTERTRSAAACYAEAARRA